VAANLHTNYPLFRIITKLQIGKDNSSSVSNVIMLRFGLANKVAISRNSSLKGLLVFGSFKW